MTVAELIAKLSELDQDARVLVHGYEGGVSDALAARRCEVALGVNEGSTIYGEHEIPDDYLVDQHGGREAFDRKFQTVKGVLIE